MPPLRRSTLIIAALAAALALIAFITAPDDPAASARDAGQQPRWLDDAQLPAESISRIDLTRRGESWTFIRDAGRWMQTQPFLHPMDGWSMQQFIQQALALKQYSVLTDDDELDPASLGLDPPRAQVRFTWDGGALTLDLGRRGVAGRAYARVAGENDVHVIEPALHERAVEADPKEWRDRVIFRNIGIDLTRRIERADGSTRLVLQRDDPRQWRMLEPAHTRVDQAALIALLEGLEKARIEGFIADQPDAPGRYGLADPPGTITVTGPRDPAARDGGVITRRLFVGASMGGTTQDRFGMIEGRPAIVRLAVAALQPLFMPATHLIARTGSGVVAADVKRIRINGPQGQFDLERNLDEWIAPDHGGMNARAAAVEQLLAHLTELRASEVLITEFPADLEVATITLFGFDGRPMDTVRIVREKPEDGRRWGMNNGDGVLRIHPASLDLNLTPAAFGLTDPLTR